MSAESAPTAPDSLSSPVQGRILVVGSVNVDLVLEVARHPAPGETLTSSRSRRSPGGKGANQACAAARLGGDVRFVGRTGTGADAAQALLLLREAGADLTGVAAVDDVETGLAVVTLDSAGENSIVLAPGANGSWDAEGAALLADDIASSDLVIAQGETPAVAVDELARLCVQTGTRFLLNLAPVIHVTAETLRAADPLVVNEHEGRLALEAMTGAPAPSDDALTVTELRRAGVRSVIMTRGSKGAIVSVERTALDAGQATPIDVAPNEEVPLREVGSPSVPAVDTTGAGDAFVGALGVGIARGEDLVTASGFAVRVGAFAVTSAGAQPSYPWPEDALPA
ncbi:ribokinase [Brachybacterium sp. NPDC056505]|uniref:ribokinase n=1 Tax=Brachybacterium sp. NPDC056505 TaxID=3345843 RepID=UPI0036731AD3